MCVQDGGVAIEHHCDGTEREEEIWVTTAMAARGSWISSAASDMIRSDRPSV